jgi:S-adenosylmethionine:diacylglycerol 3-amino-3-carboxypropyl transferase
MKHLGPDARPRNWLRTAAELSEAADRVEQQLAERFTSAEMVADLAAEDHGATALKMRVRS